MELETSDTESYNRKRIIRYVGESVATLTNTTDFTSTTFTTCSSYYKVISLPVHLTLYLVN